MASTPVLRQQPSFRRDSPSPSLSPTPAIGAVPELDLSRCVSTGSTVSDTTGSMGRESLSSTRSSIGTSVSRSSSASYTKRQSFGGLSQSGRRGYVRPQGTNFAASAQSRESVLSLGSIAHLQYYFARTGLLDGKGGRLAKKKDNRTTLDLSILDTSFLAPRVVSMDADSSYASMGSSPELNPSTLGGLFVESPIQDDDEYYSGEEDENHPHMLPPTVSTYNSRQKPIPHPPSLEDLKATLRKALAEAAQVLDDAKKHPVSPPSSPSRPATSDGQPRRPTEDNQGWYELQGMNILDIMTLAIRAAKIYYTAHNQPARLSAIKSERKIRTELLSVMEVLKKMATRNFSMGVRADERTTMETWVESVYEMLRQEEAMEDAERKQRRSWTWLEDSWTGSETDRELAFMRSMDPDSPTFPNFKFVDDVEDDEELPTEFLKDLSTGLRLVHLHNSAVWKSKRTFGAIDKWHTNFGKPYRMAENLRWWVKAAELRWEVTLKVDVMGVVQGTADRTAWKGFEEAVFMWCRKVREEISMELKV